MKLKVILYLYILVLCSNHAFSSGENFTDISEEKILKYERITLQQLSQDLNNRKYVYVGTKAGWHLIFSDFSEVSDETGFMWIFRHYRIKETEAKIDNLVDLTGVPITSAIGSPRIVSVDLEVGVIVCKPYNDNDND